MLLFTHYDGAEVMNLMLLEVPAIAELLQLHDQHSGQPFTTALYCCHTLLAHSIPTPVEPSMILMPTCGTHPHLQHLPALPSTHQPCHTPKYLPTAPIPICIP